MIAVDTSVVVASFAGWHTQHDAAMRATTGDVVIPAQAFLESYAVLTRLPSPHRVPPAIAAEYLTRRFPEDRVLQPGVDIVARLPHRCQEAGLLGGATYDALIGLTCLDAGAELRTLDRRSLRTHRALGVDVRLIS